MDITKDITTLLEQSACPAFLVHDGIIRYVNQSAKQYGIEINTEIMPLIHSGEELYHDFREGRLCLALEIGGAIVGATADRTETHDVFYLDTEYSDLQMRTFALVSQILREPLSGAMSSAETLSPDVQTASDPEAAARLQQLNRNLHRLHRAICNMSDVAAYETNRTALTGSCEFVSFINEIIRKAADMLESSGVQIEYSSPSSPIFGIADSEKLERAILNLISNAVKFSNKEYPIKICLEKHKQRVVFSITNTTDRPAAQIQGQLFSNYQRTPGLESSMNGIGLGMSIVRKTALSHGGTVLFDFPDAQTARITMHIPIRKKDDRSLRAPVLYPLDYAGGYDHILTELSDILSSELYL